MFQSRSFFHTTPAYLSVLISIVFSQKPDSSIEPSRIISPGVFVLLVGIGHVMMDVMTPVSSSSFTGTPLQLNARPNGSTGLRRTVKSLSDSITRRPSWLLLESGCTSMATAICGSQLGIKQHVLSQVTQLVAALRRACCETCYPLLGGFSLHT